jgi:hypothetical protein
VGVLTVDNGGSLISGTDVQLGDLPSGVGEATAALIKADRLAPEHVRTPQAAPQCLDDLLAQSGRRPPADLTDLAQRAGLR